MCLPLLLENPIHVIVVFVIGVDMLQDPSAERAVLAGIYTYGIEAYMEVGDLISSDTFTDRANQALYKCFQYLLDDKEIEKIDQSSVFSASEQLEFQWLFNKQDECAHVKGIFETQTELENVRKWATKIKKLEVTRELKKKLEYANERLDEVTGDESIEEILSVAESPIFEFVNVSAGSSNHPKPLFEGYRENLLELYKNPIELIGISSGYPCYDEMIGGGFRRKAVSLIGARTGVGKSMVAANIGWNVVKNLNIPVLFIDTEMDSNDYANRVFANITQVSINELETGKFGKDGLAIERIKKGMVRAEGANSLLHYINVNDRPFEDGISIMRRWINREVGFDQGGNLNHCLIIYDYIKLMSGALLSGNLAEHQVLGFMTTSLHNFAVQNDVPILAFTQLNRDGIDKESTGVISGSDRIGFLATNFALFKEKGVEEIAEVGGLGTHKLFVAKARHGSKCAPDNYINMRMIGKFGQLIELDTKHNILRGKIDGMLKDIPVDEIDMGEL